MADTRPTFDYVRAGDVIRGSVTVIGNFFGYPDPQVTAVRQKLAANFIVRAIDTSQWNFGTLGGGPLIMEVQPLGDYASITNVADILAHAVYESGYEVGWADTRAEFISKVEQTGGTPSPQIPSPYQYGGGSGVGRFFENLTESPMSLAIIFGSAVVLLLVLKR